MSKKKRTDLQAAAADLGKTTAFDRLLDASADGISTLVPFAGGLVAGLIRQAAPRDDKIYLEAFARAAADRIGDLEADKIDRSYFETPEWQGDVNRVMDALREERNRSKREHYLAALANTASTDRPDQVERHRFLDLLQSVRPSHLRLLAVIATAEVTGSAGGGDIDTYLTTRLPDQDLENIKLDWADLERAGAIAGLPGGLANTAVHLRVWNAFSAFGKRFAAFIEAEPEQNG
jgi:hypothetical protein